MLYLLFMPPRCFLLSAHLCNNREKIQLLSQNIHLKTTGDNRHQNETFSNNLPVNCDSHLIFIETSSPILLFFLNKTTNSTESDCPHLIQSKELFQSLTFNFVRTRNQYPENRKLNTSQSLSMKCKQQTPSLFVCI